MGRPRKNAVETVKVVNDDGQVVDVTDVGVPGLFAPQEWDIAEEFQNNEALREHRREIETDL